MSYTPLPVPQNPEQLPAYLYGEIQKLRQILTPSQGSYTATLTGCTTNPTGTVYFVVSVGIVYLTLPQITGTSNTTAATLTGLPRELYPLRAQYIVPRVQDNGTWDHGMGLISDSNGVITLYRNATASDNDFTSSGNKGVTSQTVSYPLG